MTTCFVGQFGRYCLASIWDAADLPFPNASEAIYVMPYRFRKIRQLKHGWAVMAGCAVTGQRMLDLLQRERSVSVAESRHIL